MPRDPSLKTVLVIGSGPIVIGQACEFDYSGVQAVRALKEEGLRVVLLNPNPATVMTEKGLCDATYLEPLRPWVVRRILEREQVDGVLTTLGGQSALNLAVECEERGIWQEFGVRLLGAEVASIRMAEDREEFRRAMESIGLPCSRGGLVRSVEEGLALARDLGYPVILRPSFTLGGEGGGIAADEDEARAILEMGIRASPVGSVQVEESLVGWKEFELEVIRDSADNGIMVCSIENVDPMGVHTGDSITVAPAQTLTDKELQTLRDWALRILRRIGVSCGGSNVQFALHPETGRLIVVEMNPRVSRSSALASKATGYPIARVATLLALGYTLDELPNRITRTTVAAFEPSLDYVCVKMPRWAFDKFPGVPAVLTTRMQSIGEVMALGRTFAEALGKAVRSLETRNPRLLGPCAAWSDDQLSRGLREATPDRLFRIVEAFRRGWPRTAIHRATAWDPWFLDQIAQMVDGLTGVASCRVGMLSPTLIREAKALGLSDTELAEAAGIAEEALDRMRPDPAFRGVDTCAGEFEARTPYFYSTYGVATEGEGIGETGVIILGSGPNRIGQGLEFDTCCVSAVEGLRDEGLRPILYNCNPETVSTDFDTADRLYFEPITHEDVMAVCRRERPRGVIVGLGGQTPLKVAAGLEESGVPILGTSPRGIALTEDRRLFADLCRRLGVRIPESRTARSAAEALEAARELGYPLILRPSFVLGGEGMAIVFQEQELRERLEKAMRVTEDSPLLLDRFLEDALELDLDVLCDGRDAVPCGILEHVEPAGVHSGDSIQVFPPQRLPPEEADRMVGIARQMAREVRAVGLMNLQFARADGDLYLLEVNPRASRTVPFLHKASGAPWARLAARLMAGRTLAEVDPPAPDPRGRVFVKVPVFPFLRLGVDPILGPEMRSTGEVLGSGPTFGLALAKGLRAAGQHLPEDAPVFVSLNDRDKARAGAGELARQLKDLGLVVHATAGTAAFLARYGVEARPVAKLGEANGTPRQDAIALLRREKVGLVLNTPAGERGRSDAAAIRMAALSMGVACITTLEGALAALEGIRALRSGSLDVCPL
ncbi:MAG TPA: carbamoyl-phosphate synthase large subunit [Myxococcota bacterium]|nr:carbamoyl-phosphate synthase large subunit [Myxococcota bacterium]HQK52186.1 carbamoyl-phosphate synthase large subunit [Myxococcota bacterium]